MILIMIGIILFVVFIATNKNLKPITNYIPILILFFVSAIINYVSLSEVYCFKLVLDESNNLIYEQIIITILSISLSLLYCSIFVTFLQRIHENEYIKKYEKNIKVQEYQYYRDILKNIPPAVLAYCYDHKINLEDSIVATLLNLELRNKIKIENKQTIIVKDKTNLHKHEKLLLEQLQTNQYEEKSFKKLFKQAIIEEMLENEYLKKTDDNVNIAYFAEVIMTWISYYIVIIAILLEDILELVFLLVFATFIVSRLCPPIYQKIQETINVNVRTKKALELGSKVKGMKNYIEDFSNIRDNEVEKIKLYEEYIIYAIILNLKGKLNNDCKKIFENIKNISINSK